MELPFLLLGAVLLAWGGMALLPQFMIEEFNTGSSPPASMGAIKRGRTLNFLLSIGRAMPWGRYMCPRIKMPISAFD